MEDVINLPVSSVEIHAGNKPLPRSLGHAIKAASGSYSSVRGRDGRFIDLPTTPEGLAVANRVLKDLGRAMTVVITHAPWITGNGAAVMSVHDLVQNQHGVEVAIERTRRAYAAGATKICPDCGLRHRGEKYRRDDLCRYCDAPHDELKASYRRGALAAKFVQHVDEVRWCESLTEAVQLARENLDLINPYFRTLK